MPVVKEQTAGAVTDDPEPITRVLVAEIGHIERTLFKV